MHDPDAFPVKDAANETLETGAEGAETAADAEQELQRALARADQYQDQFLRAKAEAENVRRRGQEDVAKAYKFAIESFAEALVPVVDSLEKALQSERRGTRGNAPRCRADVEAAVGGVCQRQSEGNRPGRTEVRPAFS